MALFTDSKFMVIVLVECLLSIVIHFCKYNLFYDDIFFYSYILQHGNC